VAAFLESCRGYQRINAGHVIVQRVGLLAARDLRTIARICTMSPRAPPVHLSDTDRGATFCFCIILVCEIPKIEFV
jgi:hypothetical protein